MPGIKSIVWNDFNDARLLQAFCFAAALKPDIAVIQQTAEIMGNGVTVNALRHRINTLKKQLRNSTTGSPSLSLAPTSRKRSASTAQTAKTSPKKRRLAEVKTEDDDLNADEVELLNKALQSGPATPSPNKRACRATPRKDYAKLADPHADEITDEGEDFKELRDAQLNEEYPESANEDDFKFGGSALGDSGSLDGF